MPKISVIMPAYNAEQYISEAIESILGQTFADFEFIIIDDGSSDSTSGIIASYKDSRIRYFRNEKNLGIVGALNRGLALAAGEYIARMDADDISLPERFQTQCAYMEKHPDVGVCGTAIKVFGKNMEEYDRFFSTNKADLKAELLFASCIAHPTAIIRRSVLAAHDLTYHEEYYGREDYALWWEISKYSALGVIPRVLHKYRIHDAQITANKSGQMEKIELFLRQRMYDLGIKLDADEEKAFAYYCSGKSDAFSKERAIFFSSALAKVIAANKRNHFFDAKALQKICDHAMIDAFHHLPPSKQKECYAAAYHIGSLSKWIAVKTCFRGITRKLRRVDHEGEIGIITCHDVYNYGATLQAFALSEYIKKHFGTCRIINYVPHYLYRLIDFMNVDAPKWKSSWWRRWIYRVYVFPYNCSLLPKYLKFKAYLRANLFLTKKYTTASALMKEMPYFDVYICGSDQIWNSVAYPCGEDPAFYLSFAYYGAKKLSYAASFGARTISEKGRYNLERYLRNYTALSVREQSGVKILHENGLEGTTVLDPVFLLPPEVWRRHKAKLTLPEKYILVYGYDNSAVMRTAVQDYANRYKCEIVDLHTDYRSAGPKEFLTLIDNAELVITSSFHAVAFSIILHTQFVTVKTKNEALFERISNILELTELQNRTYGSRTEHIDFDAVDRRLQPEITKAKAFLRVIGGYHD